MGEHERNPRRHEVVKVKRIRNETLCEDRCTTHDYENKQCRPEDIALA